MYAKNVFKKREAAKTHPLILHITNDYWSPLQFFTISFVNLPLHHLYNQVVACWKSDRDFSYNTIYICLLYPWCCGRNSNGRQQKIFVSWAENKRGHKAKCFSLQNLTSPTTLFHTILSGTWSILPLFIYGYKVSVRICIKRRSSLIISLLILLSSSFFSTAHLFQFFRFAW